MRLPVCTEAWLRLSGADASRVDDLGAWLTTVVARICLNTLRSRATRREEPIDVYVPDPVVSPVGAVDPPDEALIADSVGLALLIVLETLGPAERLAFVLHDVFDVPFEEIARIIDRSEPAARQLGSRARRRLPTAVTPDADLSSQWSSSTRSSPQRARTTSKPSGTSAGACLSTARLA